MNVLKKYRTTVSVRQADFADKVGVSQATISKIECGEALPSLELAVAIERATSSAVPAASWIPDVSAEQPSSEQEAAQ